jgi:acetyl esterase/lipase
MNTLFIAGNSAGAQLTSQMAALITNEDFANQMDLQPAIIPEQLKGVVLINGIYNMQTLRDTGFPNIEQYLWAYTRVRDFEMYHRVDELSTIEQVTADYPPVFITAGDIDPLASQTLEMIDVLANNDVDVTSVLFTGTNANLDHDFIINLDQPASQETFEKLIEFIDQHHE